MIHPTTTIIVPLIIAGTSRQLTAEMTIDGIHPMPSNGHIIFPNDGWGTHHIQAQMLDPSARRLIIRAKSGLIASEKDMRAEAAEAGWTVSE